MRPRTLILLAASVIVLVAVFFYWLGGHVASKKIVIVKKEVTAVVPKVKKPAMQRFSKSFKNPKVAIVIDDFGYNMKDMETLLAIKEPVTFSILPDLPYSRKIAVLARSRGKEVILHMPMESHNSASKEEIDTIKVGMPEKEIKTRLKKGIDSVPGLTGISNHTGSKATEDKELMMVVLKYLKDANLYFFDSMTSDKSVGGEVAGSIGLRHAKRDMFLDNIDRPDAIEHELMDLRKMAFKKGRAIAICHDRKNTINVLSKVLPEMARDGIVFVNLSDMVK